VDGLYNSDPGMRDVGIYISAAKDILQKQNPYNLDNVFFKSGSFGVLIFSFGSLNLFTFVMIQVLNLVGLALFIGVMSRNLVKKEFLFLVYAVALWSSCVREISSTGQITGILLGLLGLAVKKLDSNTFSNKVTSGLLFAICIDLKPNLFFFFIVSCYIFFGQIKNLVIPFFILLLGHILVDVYTGAFLEKDWMRVIGMVNSTADQTIDMGSKTIWSNLKMLFGFSGDFDKLPVIFFIFLGVVSIIKITIKPSFAVLALTLILPYFYSYFYLYSLVSIIVLALVFALVVRMPIWLGLIMPLLLKTGSDFDLKHAVYCISICGAFIFILRQINRENTSLDFLTKYLAAVLSVTILRLVLNFANMDSKILEEIFFAFLVLFSIAVFSRLEKAPITG
jgi:hypothetical protein